MLANGLLSIKPPTVPNSQMYSYADYVELLCMVNIDGVVSQEYIRDRCFGDYEGGTGSNFESQRQDAQSIRVADWFAHLKHRQNIFDDAYPFYLSSDGKELCLHENLTLQHKLYIFLLISSNLRYVPNDGTRNDFTHDFERLSQEVLRNYLPAHANVFVFGSGSPHCAPRYRGNTQAKIKTLATDLNADIFDREEFSPTSVGDEGLDLVAWVPSGDNESEPPSTQSRD